MDYKIYEYIYVLKDNIVVFSKLIFSYIKMFISVSYTLNNKFIVIKPKKSLKY